MIIYRQNIENGVPIYEIITKTFKTITVKCDETFSKYEIYKLLSTRKWRRHNENELLNRVDVIFTSKQDIAQNPIENLRIRIYVLIIP